MTLSDLRESQVLVDSLGGLRNRQVILYVGVKLPRWVQRRAQDSSWTLRCL
jgi:hypothetical protein